MKMLNDYLIGAAILGAVAIAIVVLIASPMFSARSAPPIAPPVVKRPPIDAPLPAPITPDEIKPKTVQVIRITPEPPPAAADPPPRRPADICNRYGGHRVDYGRRWRCIYPHKRH